VNPIATMYPQLSIKAASFASKSSPAGSYKTPSLSWYLEMMRKIVQAITNIVINRGIKGQEAEDRITDYVSMVEDFEANCIGMNIQIWRLKVDPWRRMLRCVQT
jgi:hypothetical protein